MTDSRLFKADASIDLIVAKDKELANQPQLWIRDVAIVNFVVLPLVSE